MWTAKVITLLIVWKLLLAIFVDTAFDPDEYWQAPEVAHRLVFGYGYLTWEWAAGLRSYAHALLFTPAYLLLQVLSVDSPLAVQVAPRITQALLSVLHDCVMQAFAVAHLPSTIHTPTPTLTLLAALSWFNSFTHTRSFSNSLESTLHLLCLTLWPYAPTTYADRTAPNLRRRRRLAAIAAAGICCVVRPTSAVLFLPLAAWEISAFTTTPPPPRKGKPPAPPTAPVTSRRTIGCLAKHVETYAIDVLMLAAIIASGHYLLDTALYGRPVFPAWANITFNVFNNGSAAYGAHPWHWYFSHGLPAMLASLLPLTLAGVCLAWKTRKAPVQRGRFMPLWPLGMALWGAVAHSCIPHKEFRFLLPSLQLLLPYAAHAASAALLAQAPSAPRHSVHDCDANALHGTGATPQPPLSQQLTAASSLRRRQGPASTHSVGPDDAEMSTAAASRPSTGHTSGYRSPQPAGWGCRAMQGGVVVLLSLQVPLLLFFGRVHQRGTLAIAEELSQRQLDAASHVLFLTNCHATPWQAHLHAPNATLSFLDCSPSGHHAATHALNAHSSTALFHLASPPSLLSEQALFQLDPVSHLCRVFGCSLASASEESGGCHRTTGTSTASTAWQAQDGAAIEDPSEASLSVGDTGERGTCSAAPAPPLLPPPTEIVLFSDLLDTIQPFVATHGYLETSRHSQNVLEGLDVVLLTLPRRGQ